ncbi:LuxR family transcriptional regulator [Nocardioides sp. CER19]|uniref:helix-turn-helix transcriptional regulator n=1 Tax=Nocardioides sp. CER19 TaxID=3038538 RepID=UPI00244BC580|nr:LuxR family transcriptional regulator [Nocardioides sp. CER19]MDH2413772.1 AAA family ATPase [Nocardioides sp. CER19]
MGGTVPELLGRSRERAELDGALNRVRDGESVVLVVRGEAGIGKTALLQYAAHRGSDCRVLAVAGVESEVELPFAALHQICGPLLGEVRAVPQHQEQALRVALGNAAGPPPDRFLVGLAVLSVLAEVAAARPVALLVDDAQWLDEASRQVLGVVARRLVAESVLFLLAVREIGESRLFPGVTELTVDGLGGDDARELVVRATAGHLDERVRERLVAETRGNPLTLLELVRGMTEAELGGGFALPSATLSPGLLEDRYLQRVRALPAPTRRLLLLAAADATGDPTLLWRAAQVAGVGHDAAEPARSERLLEIGSGVRFRHPLMRAAAYAAASAEERREAHRALAGVIDPHIDPDRRVWHLAAAATGPDEAVAAELERSATRAEARAGLPAAAAFLQRSVGLTVDRSRRADRALAAAHAHLHAGAYDAGLGVLAEAEADAVDDLRRARVERLRAEINRASLSGRDAPLLLLQAAERLQSLDPVLARETHLDAWGAALVAGALASPGGDLVAVSTAARAVLAATPGREPCAHLLSGLSTLILDSPREAAPALRRALTAFIDDGAVTDEWLHYGALVSNAALTLWDFAAWDAASARHVELARASGALAPLVTALNVRRVVAMFAGDFDAARSEGVAEEVAKQVTGTRRASYGDLFQAAFEGDPERAHRLITTTADEALARGEGLGWHIADRASALLHLGVGRYADASAAAARAAESNLGPFTAQALPDLVEAAARSGQPELAADALLRLQAAVRGCDTDWATGVEARSRALLIDGTEAEKAYDEAIGRLGRTPLRAELARAELVYGEWLRREGRRSAARTRLRSAHDTFVELGMEAFAERARREMAATGEKVRRRVVETLNQLTPQEEHIARLARDGQSNPEIAAELFISSRTVEWHLRKVFGKLGITSRRELREALPAHGRVGV